MDVGSGDWREAARRASPEEGEDRDKGELRKASLWLPLLYILLPPPFLSSLWKLVCPLSSQQFPEEPCWSDQVEEVRQR